MPGDLLKDNNETLWDWITWETLGNPSAQYRKGDEMRWYGLWRADYAKLCKGPRHEEPGTLGRGSVKILVLPSCDYGQHKALIKTFLPFMDVTNEGELVDPLSGQLAQQQQAPMWVIMPYNYDDNSAKSSAIGTREVPSDWADRLADELPRWSTASRSCVVAVEKGGVDVSTLHKPKKKHEPAWPFREVAQDAAKIFGPHPGLRRQWTLSNVQKNLEDVEKIEFTFYSVKTGVQFVGQDDQQKNGKDRLEGNSVHAMLRSQLFSHFFKRHGRDALETRHQIEILSILIATDADYWDGFQVRDLGSGEGEIWFPALAIPSSGKAFAQHWGGTNAWVDFWRANFAQRLGRAKAEMLALFGLQHVSYNAQNMLVAFERDKKGGKALSLTLRDVGDTLYNSHVFKILGKLDKVFEDAWALEVGSPHGLTLDNKVMGGGYAHPRITRLGTTAAFFFPPFIQGDIESSGPAHILADWGIAHNEAYLDYFIDKVGYKPTWDPEKNEDNAKELQLDYYLLASNPNENAYLPLSQSILKLHSQTRLGLLEQVKGQLAKLDKNDVKTARAIVETHDFLIGAEIQCYINSKAGTQAIQKLFKKPK